MDRVSEIMLYKMALIFCIYLSRPVLGYGKMYMHMELHKCVFPVGKKHWINPNLAFKLYLQRPCFVSYFSHLRTVYFNCH